jgi:predicted transglutaminase-like cysteine proteinase
MRPLRADHLALSARASELAVWRRQRLLQAGIPAALAAVVAHDERYDLHALLVLIDRGCDAELAVRILAPLEEDPE